jgi:RNA polymerase sigma-70 factor (ECF subfamily)
LVESAELATSPQQSRIVIDPPAFEELIRRVRAGDEEAAAVLVRHYEPYIRRTVRFRLADARLGNLLESMDICQSVLASFFVRAASGQFELKTPAQLLNLLATMARNKLTSQARKQHAKRREGRRLTSGVELEGHVVATDASPSRQIAVRDLLQEVHRRLSADERRILELRNNGCDWATTAAEIGGNPEALRRKLSRALDRVAEQLGLDDAP